MVAVKQKNPILILGKGDMAYLYTKKGKVRKKIQAIKDDPRRGLFYKVTHDGKTQWISARFFTDIPPDIENPYHTKNPVERKRNSYLKTYKVTFSGRPLGAIGKFYTITKEVYADSVEAAKQYLFDSESYEVNHIKKVVQKRESRKVNPSFTKDQKDLILAIRGESAFMQIVDKWPQAKLNKIAKQLHSKKLLTSYNTLNSDGYAVAQDLLRKDNERQNPANISTDDFTRITNDTYGNPRYVIHFLRIASTYDKALKLARKVGGRKFHNKQYGGGIVFQTYDLNRLIDRLNGVAENPKQKNLIAKDKYGKMPNPTVTEFKKHVKDRLHSLAKMFQGHANGEMRKVLESDFTPANKYRLGYLVQIKVKNGRETTTINFDGESYLSADAKNNLYIVGKDSRLEDVRLPKKGQLLYLGELVQIDYVTAKKHIEAGKTIRFYHKLGEATKEFPNVFIDHDGFLLIQGGNYDIWDVGIVN